MPKVYPVEGRTARDPVTKRVIGPEGREVPDSTFWHRRLRDGDVTLEAPPPAPAPAPSEPPAEPAPEPGPPSEPHEG